MILPEFQLAGTAPDPLSGTVVFSMTPSKWKGRPQHSADYQLLPVAWTSFQMAASVGMDEAAWLASFATVQPAFRFAQAGSLVRLPRVLMYQRGSGADSISAEEMFGPLAAALAAANVLVSVPGALIDAFGNLGVCGLPPTAAPQKLTDVNGFTAWVPEPDDGHWQGGEVLQIRHSNVNPPDPTGDQAGWQLKSVSLGHSVVVDDADVNDAVIALYVAEYPRYRKFAYHLISTTGSFGLPDPGDETAAEAAVPAIQAARMAELADVGGTLLSLAGDVNANRQTVIASARQKAIAFFDLKV